MHDAAADQAAERAAWRAAWIDSRVAGLVDELTAAGWDDASTHAAAGAVAGALGELRDDELVDDVRGHAVVQAVMIGGYAEPPPQQPSPCPWCGAFSPPPW